VNLLCDDAQNSVCIHQRWEDHPMFSRRKLISQSSVAFLTASSSFFLRPGLPAFADDPCLSVGINWPGCQITGGGAPDPDAGGDLDNQLGDDTGGDDSDDSEGGPLSSSGSTGGDNSPSTDSTSTVVINENDPNYIAAVNILSDGNTSLSFSQTYEGLGYVCDVVAFVLALFTIEEWGIAAAAWAAVGLISGTVGKLAKYFGGDPPRPDTSVTTVYRLRAINLPTLPTPQSQALQLLTASCFQLGNALPILSATKERIETLKTQSNSGSALAAQFAALQANAGICANLAGEIAGQAQLLAGYLQALQTQPPPPPPPVTPSTPVSPLPNNTAATVLSGVSSLHQTARSQIVAQFQPGPITLKRYDNVAAAFATVISKAPLVPMTGSQLMAKAAGTFQNASTSGREFQTYLANLAATAKLAITGPSSPTAPTAGGGATGPGDGSKPTKPIPGSGTKN
jgi:hypothetical protein